MSVGRAERYIFPSLTVLPKRHLVFVNACCPPGERKAILIYISLALLPNRVSRFERSSVVKFLNPCATKNNIYFLRSLSVLPKRNLFFVNACCPRGELKAILTILPLLFISFVLEACCLCVTESQIYLPITKACCSSGTQSNVSFQAFLDRLINRV